MRRFFRWLIPILLVLTIIYLLGPAPEPFDFEAPLPASPYTGKSAVETATQLADDEAGQPLKPGNAATVLWADSSRPVRTRYVMLYLPGFTASHEEGNPVHRRLAARFGCNLLLARLAGHGLKTDTPFLNLTAGEYWLSVVNALRMAEQLGDSVILISTSTGGTLANMLCAHPATRSRIAGSLLYSPNIRIADPAAFLLNNHWGLQMARLVLNDSNINSRDQRPWYKQYWYSRYRIEGAVALQEILETAMNGSTFRAITQPVLLLYYYQDDSHQDAVVRVDAMREMFGELGTPAGKKQEMAIPGAGDHVIANPQKSKASEAVYEASETFLRRQKGWN